MPNIDIGIDVVVNRNINPAGLATFDIPLILGMSGNAPQDQYDEFRDYNQLDGTYGTADHPHINEFGRIMFEMGASEVHVYNVARSTPSSGQLSTALDSIEEQPFKYIASTTRNGSNPDSDDASGDYTDVSNWAESNDRFYLMTNEIGQTPGDQQTFLNGISDDNNIWVAFENSGRSLDNLDQPVDAALAGKAASLFPGSFTAKAQRLGDEVFPRTSADEWYASDYSNSEVGTIETNGGNVYVPSAGQRIISDGLSLDPDIFWDVEVLRLWLQEDITVNITQLIAQEEKIPYDSDGLAQIKNQVRESFERGVENDVFVEDGVTLQFPNIEDVSQQDKADRILNNANFQAQIAGAIHDFNITGTLTV